MKVKSEMIQSTPIFSCDEQLKKWRCHSARLFIRSSFTKEFFFSLKRYNGAEMEFCASAASMLAEEIWQIAEGFVEVLRKYVDSI